MAEIQAASGREMYIGPQVDTPPPAHRAEMDDNRHLAGKGHSAAPQMHAKRPDALSIKSRVIRDHLGQALPNEQRAVTLRPSLNRAPSAAAAATVAKRAETLWTLLSAGRVSHFAVPTSSSRRSSNLSVLSRNTLRLVGDNAVCVRARVYAQN